MIDPKRLLADLQARQRKLEADLRQQLADHAPYKQPLETEYQAARKAQRTADTFSSWCDARITLVAVAWLLAATFVRFCEDNGLLQTPRLAGPGDALRRAKDAASEYFRAHPTENERHYFEHVFEHMAGYPALAGLFGRAHNPLYTLPPSFEAARDLLAFWQQTDPDSGTLRHDFTDPVLGTRFLGDLYQDLSEAARKRYALLQTPEFVEEFILERTLEPAIKTFGLEGLRLIDPTCGSGHFLLGSFARLLTHWQREAPGRDAREHVMHALAGVYGVDLNPFAVAIARFRLLMVALKASGIHTLREAPAWRFNLTVGDSLAHGPRLGADELALAHTDEAQEYAHVYAAEDRAELHRILGQRYHAVVGNPPYITASDKAANALYRHRYRTCHRQFSLGVPFTERFFQLSLPPSANAPAGFVGLITTDSFMKREFGKKLIEVWLPTQDLSHLIHTSGAYIPGHGTPTVILLGRNRPPVAETVRAVLGIRGEPSTPDDPAQGKVWRSIVELVDHPGRANNYISVVDMQRSRLASHPWSLQGGIAPSVLEAIKSAAESALSDYVDQIGFGVVTREDDVFLLSQPVARRLGVCDKNLKPLVAGDEVRDWCTHDPIVALWPYDPETLAASVAGKTQQFLWKYRAQLSQRVAYGHSQTERGLAWFEYSMFFKSRYRVPLSITFAFVATHNHFVLDRGGKVFNRTAPVIKLPADASEDDHLGLVGLLNSSTACFWFKQVCFNKGMGEEFWADRFEHDSTKLGAFPVIEERPLALARQLDGLAREREAQLPAALASRLPLSRAALDQHRAQAHALLARMIALQEELDWWCYRAYGLLDEDLTFDGEPPGIGLGQRAFEIVLARRIQSGDTHSRWFERHASTPMTAPPVAWRADYRALIERRIALIETNAWIKLLERPEYKRRWQQAPWPQLERDALRHWLLDRLETAHYWPSHALASVAELAARAHSDSAFQAVAQLYTGQPGFDVAALLGELLEAQSVPALQVLRYKEAGLRKRADWQRTWQAQRREDTIDAEVACANPREDGESEADWQARIQPECEQRKLAEVGKLLAPPKYASSDFLKTDYWRMRGKLDVPKERFFAVPDPADPRHWRYGWAGWNPAQRVKALAAAWIEGEQHSGVDPVQLLPLLVAIHEALPWVAQWHNAIDPDTDVRPGDFFSTWLAEQLSRHGWSHQTLSNWRPAAQTRRRRTN